MRTYDRGFRKLIAWQRSHALTKAIYSVTEKFPREEKYGITDQLRRASSSVGAQLSEGSRMSTHRHQKLYYERANASLSEVDNFLELAFDLKMMGQNDYEQLLEMLNITSFLITKLVDSCRGPTRLTKPK